MAKRPRRRGPVPGLLPRAIPLAVLALMLAPRAGAESKVIPTVSATQTYTDNANLAPSEFARGQFITDIAPALVFVENSSRLKLSAAYQAHLFLYDRKPANTYNTLSQYQVDGQAKLIEDFLFLDGSAMRGPRSISAVGAQPGDALYANGNRTEVSTYRISPYVRHRFGAEADLTARYTRDSVNSGNGVLGDTKGDSVALNLASGPNFKTLGWGLDYRRARYDNAFAGQSNDETAQGDLRYRLSRTLALTAAAGYDKYDYQSLGGGSTAGRNWSGGFIWTPSTRTNVQASAGRHFFGKTGSLAASHRSRHTVWSVNYSDGVTTSRQQFLLPAAIDTASMLDRMLSNTILDPLARQQAVAAYIAATGLPPSLADNINYFSNRYLRQKQLQGAVALEGAHSTTLFSVYKSERTALSTQQTDSSLVGSDILALSDNNKQVGVTGTFTYRLSPRSDVLASLNAARITMLTNGLVNNSRVLRAGMTHRFNPKLRGAVELRHAQGATGSLDGATYRENAVSATLSMQF